MRKPTAKSIILDNDNDYIIMNSDGTNVMIRCKDTVLGFDTFKSFFNAINKNNAEYRNTDR